MAVYPARKTDSGDIVAGAVLHSKRRAVAEQLDYNLLFRWFIGLAVDEEVWDQSTFSESRERLLAADMVGKFFYMIREQAREQGLLSDQHFTVDTTLINALASQRNFPAEGRGTNGVKGRLPEKD